MGGDAEGGGAVSDPEELRAEARDERRSEPQPAYRWEYVACNWVRVPVGKEPCGNEITATKENND